MSNEFGYVGTAKPTQAVLNNSGVFSVNEHKELIEDKKILSFGQLQHIQTQATATDVSAIDFTAIQENKYNVHLLLAQGVSSTGSAQSTSIRFSHDNGSSFNSSARYDRALNGQRLSSGLYEEKNSGDTEFQYAFGNDGDSAVYDALGLIWLYNLGDSSKYSFGNEHSIGYNTSNNNTYCFMGNIAYKDASVVNGIRIYQNGGSNFRSATGSLSLFGVELA